MRVYHFLNAKNALDDIRKRRIKVSTVSSLNDPFEGLAAQMDDHKMRNASFRMKNHITATIGLVCFSDNYHSPVMWSHYADRHRGICLGFDVVQEHLFRVDYSKNRLTPDAHWKLLWGHKLNGFLGIKSAHWKYEKEMRLLLNLKDLKKGAGLYFLSLSDNVKLTEVVNGYHSEVSRRDIADALGTHKESVDVFKVRPAFDSFQMVRNGNELQWL